jgi:hypothetical protein
MRFEPIVNINRKVQIGNSNQTLFWQDTWHGEVHFKIVYYDLFRICTTIDITVAIIAREGFGIIIFKRQLSDIQRQMFVQLQQ